MRDSIVQFMWGFQAHFRYGVEHDLESCLEAVGIHTEPQVLLIGFAREGHKEHPSCVEPEWGAFTSEHLDGVTARGDELYDDDPESKYIESYPPLHEARHAWLRRRSRAEAIRERLESHDGLGDHSFFVSSSTPVDGYDVHVCIGLPNSVIRSVPTAGDATRMNRLLVERSLVSAVVNEVLSAADLALHLPDPGSSAIYVLNRSRSDLVRQAALRFAQSCVVRSGDSGGGDLFQHMNEITATAYEGSAASGHLVLAGRHAAEAVEVVVKLDEPVHLRSTRSIRKLLEVTAPDFRLLVDDNAVYGIGRVRPDASQGQAEPAYLVDVTAHATWDLTSGSASLMRVAYGVASLPRPLLDPRLFGDAIQRLFDIGEDRIGNLWNLVEAAAAASHGTILAIVDGAAEEAVRLQSESTRIEPMPLTAELTRRVSAIDGAILVDPDGTCHAIGLILDGLASGTGDRGRGARFNSALRYTRSTGHRSLLVVVSEDGSVEFVPPQRPRIHRARITAAIGEFRAAVATGDGELYGRARDHLEELAFYLDEAQCAEANEIDEIEQRSRRESGGFELLGRSFSPHPDMDDSYLLPK